MYFGWSTGMHEFNACFKNYNGSDYTFSGNIRLKNAYYCKYNIHGLLNKILPFLYNETRQKHINLIQCNDDKKNNVIREYVKLLDINNITFYKACDIRYVENLVRLPLNQTKMQSIRDNHLYTADWLNTLRCLIRKPGDIKKIVILRVDRHRRFQPDILTYLLSEGFCPVVLDDMSIQEEIDMFAGVEHIIGNHGSGLSNLVYCSPGAKLLEITRGDYHYVYPEFVDYTNELLKFTPPLYHQQIFCDSDLDPNIEKTPYTNIDRFIRDFSVFMRYGKDG